MSKKNAVRWQDIKDISEGNINPANVSRLMNCSIRQARRKVSEYWKERKPGLRAVYLGIMDKCPHAK